MMTSQVSRSRLVVMQAGHFSKPAFRSAFIFPAPSFTTMAKMNGSNSASSWAVSILARKKKAGGIVAGAVGIFGHSSSMASRMMTLAFFNLAASTVIKLMSNALYTRKSQIMSCWASCLACLGRNRTIPVLALTGRVNNYDVGMGLLWTVEGHMVDPCEKQHGLTISSLSNSATFKLDHSCTRRDVILLLDGKVTNDSRWNSHDEAFLSHQATLSSRTNILQRRTRLYKNNSPLVDTNNKYNVHLRPGVHCYSSGKRNKSTLAESVFASSAHVGIIGPNASGKRRLLREIETVATTMGKRVQVVDFKSHRNLVSENPSTTVARVLGGFENADVVVRFGLTPIWWRTVGSLSTGEVRKVILAKAVSTSPDLLLFDRPFDGLDAKSRDALLILLEDLTSGKPAARPLVQVSF